MVGVGHMVGMKWNTKREGGGRGMRGAADEVSDRKGGRDNSQVSAASVVLLCYWSTPSVEQRIL